MQKIRTAHNKSDAIWKIIGNETKRKTEQKEINISPDVLNKHFACIGSMTSNKCAIGESKPLELLKKAKIKSVKSIFLNECTITELRKAMKKIKPKSSRDIYGMTTTILKDIFPLIETILCSLISKCLQEGYFPEQLKKARIVPIYKKGDSRSPESYRPISVLPVLSKLFEAIIRDRMIYFLSKQGIFCTQQHGFLANRSVETALTEILKKISESFDSKKKSSLQACDLSKAFDSIKHSVLLEKLEFYGIRGVALDLMKSYLTVRTQKTCINQKSSSWEGVEHGIPQGSILGPILFVIYINDLPANVTADQTILFADDTTFLNVGVEDQELREKDEKTMVEAKSWFDTNGMMMNIQKTQTLLFETKPSSDCSMKLLGITLLPNLSFSQHIDMLVPRLSRATYTVRRIMQLAGPEAAKIAYFGHFHSALNFGILFWGDSPECIRIFRKQKNAIRVLCGANGRQSCRELFPKEGILTLTGIFIMACVIYVYDHKEILRKNSCHHEYETRTRNYFTIPYHRVNAAQMSINHLAIKLFNKIPSKLKEAKREKLKVELKRMLVERAYYNTQEFFNDNLE